MKYTLNDFIRDLDKYDQDLPIILSQKESPSIFQSLYINQVHLMIKENINTMVGDLLSLAKYFTKIQKDSVGNEQIHLTKIIDNVIYNMTVTGVKELYGNVYLVLDEED